MREIWALVNEMSPYLLLGFSFAGLLHSFVPASLYRRYLGKNSFSSVIWAALLGVPLPLCSCGVIPTAMSLRKEGASKGAGTEDAVALSAVDHLGCLCLWLGRGLSAAS